jgi:hypothetical protein
MHLTPAGFPSGIPGSGEDMERAMQQAPQPERHFITMGSKFKVQSSKFKVQSSKFKVQSPGGVKITKLFLLFLQKPST